MKNPPNKKEQGLLKGAIRRVFSRSELRRQVVEKSLVKEYFDPESPRVKKWFKCPECVKMIPAYKGQVDHQEPLIPIDSSLEEMSWDEVVDRAWCNEDNLKLICIPCHKVKSKAENKERRRIKKEGKK